jgi:hypothetical protein
VANPVSGGCGCPAEAPLPSYFEALSDCSSPWVHAHCCAGFLSGASSRPVLYAVRCALYRSFGTTHAFGCFPGLSASGAFGGWYQVDDAVPGGTGCRSPNPFTLDCTCAAGTTPSWTGRVLAPHDSGMIGSTLALCFQPGVAAPGFFGAFQQDDPVPNGDACRAPNPYTGNCTCAGGTAVASSVRVIVDVAGGGIAGSHITFCTPATGAGAVTLCSGVTADGTGASDASSALQQCLNQTPAGGVLELPPAVLGMAGQVTIPHAMTIRTAGRGAGSPSCTALTAGCTVLRALDALDAQFGALTRVCCSSCARSSSGPHCARVGVAHHCKQPSRACVPVRRHGAGDIGPEFRARRRGA